MSALWEEQDFRRLLVGQWLSALGDWTATVALVALALELSGSPAAVSGVLVLRLAPGVVAGPVAARVARRWDRRRTMLAMDAVRAVLACLLPLFPTLLFVYIWAFAMELTSLIFLPARDASVPELVHEDQLNLANSLLLLSSYGAIPLGAAVFSAATALTGMVVGHAGFHIRFAAAFAFDAATFAASFVLIRSMGSLRRPAGGGYAGLRPAGSGPASPQAEAADAVRAGVAQETGPRRDRLRAATFSDGLRIPLVRWLLPAAITAAVGVGSLFTLGLPLLRQLAGGTTTGFGLLVADFGLGACLGVVVISRSPRMGLSAVRLGVAVQGALFVLVAVAPNQGTAFLAAGGFGASAAVTLAVGISCLQTNLEPDSRQVALLVFHVVIRVALSAAALAAGVVAAWLEPQHWPILGTVDPVRQILLASGLLALTGAALVKRPPPPEPPGTSAPSRRLTPTDH